MNLGLRGGVDAIEAPRVETERGMSPQRIQSIHQLINIYAKCVVYSEKTPLFQLLTYALGTTKYTYGTNIFTVVFTSSS